MAHSDEYWDKLAKAAYVAYYWKIERDVAATRPELISEWWESETSPFSKEAWLAVAKAVKGL